MPTIELAQLIPKSKPPVEKAFRPIVHKYLRHALDETNSHEDRRRHASRLALLLKIVWAWSEEAGAPVAPLLRSYESIKPLLATVLHRPWTLEGDIDISQEGATREIIEELKSTSELAETRTRRDQQSDLNLLWPPVEPFGSMRRRSLERESPQAMNDSLRLFSDLDTRPPSTLSLDLDGDTL